jgi:hypothetical protein
MTTTTATTTTYGPAIWATTKGLAAGDQVAKGQPKSEPMPAAFATVASVEMKSTGHKVITLESGDTFGLGGVATKVWIRKALAQAANVVPLSTVARRGAKATKAAREARKAGPKATLTAEREAARKAATPKARPATKALAASPSMKSAAAARVGEDATKGAGKGLTGYVVRWPQAGYDVLVRTDAAPGSGPAWLVRCNDHGATAPAANVKAAFDLARKGDGIAAWCPSHAAAAK